MLLLASMIGSHPQFHGHKCQGRYFQEMMGEGANFHKNASQPPQLNTISHN